MTTQYTLRSYLQLCACIIILLHSLSILAANCPHDSTITQQFSSGHNQERVENLRFLLEEQTNDPKNRLDTCLLNLSSTFKQLLIRAVGKPRSESSPIGQEGFIGIHQANKIIEKITDPALHDYVFNQFLSLFQSLSQTEEDITRAILLLKATANLDIYYEFEKLRRYHDELQNLSPSDLIDFSSLVNISTGLKEFRQCFYDSCGPTAAQVLKGESDPIYALDRRYNGYINEQKNWLNSYGGHAVFREDPQAFADEETRAVSKGLSADQLSQLMKQELSLNNEVKGFGLESSQKKTALNEVSAYLFYGQDVLFSIAGHFCLFMDIKLHPDYTADFLIFDPWMGKVFWLNESYLLGIQKSDYSFLNEYFVPLESSDYF